MWQVALLLIGSFIFAVFILKLIESLKEDEEKEEFKRRGNDFYFYYRKEENEPEININKKEMS